MCITWEIVFSKCARTKETEIHLYCYSYRRTRTCEVEEVRRIHRRGLCDGCKALETELAGRLAQESPEAEGDGWGYRDTDEGQYM